MTPVMPFCFSLMFCHSGRGEKYPEIMIDYLDVFTSLQLTG
jgi:hypothetical protein